MEQNRTYISQDHSRFSLCDCRAEDAEWENGILTLFFPKGIGCVTYGDDVPNTGPAQISFRTDPVKTFKLNVHSGTDSGWLCSEYTAENLVKTLHSGQSVLKFSDCYYGSAGVLYKGSLWRNDGEFAGEAELQIWTKKPVTFRYGAPAGKLRPDEIVTERLVLAEIRIQDERDLIGLLRDPDVWRTYMVPDLPSAEEQAAMFERYRKITENKTRFAYGIYREGRLIGVIHETERQEDTIELGWLISPALHNNGYAAEAVRACIIILYSLGFMTVTAGAFADNLASIRVMEKCSMERTGKTEEIEYRGKTHTCVYYAIHRYGPQTGEERINK